MYLTLNEALQMDEMPRLVQQNSKQTTNQPTQPPTKEENKSYIHHGKEMSRRQHQSSSTSLFHRCGRLHLVSGTENIINLCFF